MTKANTKDNASDPSTPAASAQSAAERFGYQAGWGLPSAQDTAAVEAMVTAAEQMGLSAEAGKKLALATFAGATELARRSDETPAVLRERVTSKGGTTAAALGVMAERAFVVASILIGLSA